MKPLRLLAAAVIAAAALSGCTTHPAAEPPPLRPGVAVGDRLTGRFEWPIRDAHLLDGYPAKLANSGVP